MTSHPLRSLISRALLLTFGALWLTPSSLTAQSPNQTPALNHNVIFLDPAHGGSDSGALVDSDPNDTLLEKDLTLAMASRLKPLLTAAGFVVLTSRDADLPASAPILTSDQRASLANHARPLACLLLHATASGSGVHLATSTLPLPPDFDAISPPAAIPWDSAQSAYLAQSRRLANQIGLSLVHARIPTLIGLTSVRPIDNLTCPALTLELAPLKTTGADPTPLSDSNYQQNVAQAVATALIAWRTQNDPTHSADAPSSKSAAKTATHPAAKTAPPPSAQSATKPAPKPANDLPAKPAAPKPAATPTPQPPAKPEANR